MHKNLTLYLFASISLLGTLIYSGKVKDIHAGECDATGPLDLYLLVPTSAHVNRTRLVEVKTLLKGLFNEADLQQLDDSGSGLRVTAITYKKLSTVEFTYLDVNNDHQALMDNIDINLTIRARAAPKDAPPTFATEGLKYFMTQYQQDIESGTRRKNVPAVLLFFVIESLNRVDLNTMAANLVSISSNLDIFSFIFIANPGGRQSNSEAIFSLPHESWNALAVDDNSDIQKYHNILRKVMCRTARGNLCLMMKDAAKKATDTKSVLMNSAANRKATNNNQAKPDRIVAVPDSCCQGVIFSKSFDSNVQKCCPLKTPSGSYNVIEIDDEC